MCWGYLPFPPSKPCSDAMKGLGCCESSMKFLGCCEGWRRARREHLNTSLATLYPLVHAITSSSNVSISTFLNVAPCNHVPSEPFCVQVDTLSLLGGNPPILVPAVCTKASHCLTHCPDASLLHRNLSNFSPD